MHIGSLIDLFKSLVRKSIEDFDPTVDDDDVLFNYINILTISPEDYEKQIRQLTCDIIITQVIPNGYRGMELFSTSYLKSHSTAKIVIVGCCYFTGYEIVPFQPLDERGKFVGIQQPWQFLFGKKEWYSPDTYSQDYLDKHIQNEFNRIEKSDMDADIKLKSYIESNFRDIFLFQTYNRPSKELLYYIIQEIVSKYNLPLSIASVDDVDVTKPLSIPPSPCVYFKLGMRFRYPSFYVENREMTTDEAYQRMSSSIPPSLININRNRIKVEEF